MKAPGYWKEYVNYIMDLLKSWFFQEWEVLIFVP